MDNASDTRTTVVALLAAEIGEFITVAEAAALLRVTKQTIYSLVADGEFGDVVRIGRAIRIPVPAFRAYMATIKVAA